MTVRPSSGATVAALGAVALWSTNALAAKAALAQLAVLQVLALQFGAAAAVFLAVGLVRAGPRSLVSGWPTPAATAIGVIGLTGTIFLQYLAFDLARILEANVLAYAWPLMVAVWAAATVRSPRTALGLGLALIGFVGVALIFDGRGDLSFDRRAGLGYLAALGSAACMAVYTVAAARFTVPGDRILVPATLLGAGLALALSMLRGEPWPAPPAWLWAIYVGLGPMAAGFALWTRAMAGDGADRLAPIGYATPLVSTLVLMASGESFTPRSLIGAALVLACSIGVLAADRLLARRRARLPARRRPAGEPATAAGADRSPGR